MMGRRVDIRDRDSLVLCPPPPGYIRVDSPSFVRLRNDTWRWFMWQGEAVMGVSVTLDRELMQRGLV